MNKSEIAKGLFANDKNCAQAVLGAFCGEYGLGQELAFKLSCGLGSGARQADVCGAVSGAILVIGLKYGADKDLCNQKTEEFVSKFRGANGSAVCREILGCDIMTPPGKEKAVSEELFTTLCPKMVGSAADILSGLL